VDLEFEDFWGNVAWGPCLWRVVDFIEKIRKAKITKLKL
jgi:hypothetical protein